VREVQIDLQSNRVAIVPATDCELDLAAVPEAIRRAGFRPSDFHVHGVGAIDPSAPDCFRFRGWSRCYEVVDRGEGAVRPHEIQARVEEQDGRVRLEVAR
jgi:hypothetical protein